MSEYTTIENEQPRLRRRRLTHWRERFHSFSDRVSGSTTRDSVLGLIDQALVSSTNFLTVLSIGRACLPAELGAYHLAWTLALLAIYAQDALIAAPYRVYCHQRRGEALATYTGSALLHHVFLSGSCLIVVLLLTTAVWLGALPGSLSTAVLVLLPAIPLMLLREFVRRLSFARLRIKTAIALDAGVAILQVSGLLLLAAAGRLSAASAYAVVGVCCALGSLGWFLGSGTAFRIRGRDAGRDWKLNWTFSKWTLGSLLVANVTPGTLLPWFLALTHGQADTGILAACHALVGLAMTLINGMENVIGPKSAHSYAENGAAALHRLIGMTTLVMAATVGPFCLFAILFGEQLAVLLYGTHYSGTGLVVAVLAFSALGNALGMPAGDGLWALERSRSNFVASTCDMVVTLVVAFCLVVPAGILGVAIATLAGTCTGSTVRWAAYLQHVRAAGHEHEAT